MDTPAKLFEYVFEQVLPVLDGFIANTSGAMAGIAGAAGSILFGIYVLFWGMAIVTGQVQEPMTDGFKRIIRGVVILMFATSAGIYGSWIVDFFTSVPGAIAAEVVQSGSSSGFMPDADMGTARMLDTALAKGLYAAGQAWSEAATIDIPVAMGYALVAIIICLVVVSVCAYAGALVLMAQLGMSIMLGIGPLFILFAMFESTQQLFVAWTRQLITFAVFFIVLAAAVSLTFSFFTPYLTLIAQSSDDLGGKSQVIIEGVKLVGICALCIIVLWQAQSWASGLAGGVAAAGSGAIGRMATSIVGGSTAGSVAAGKLIAHREEVKDADGKVTGKRWAGAAPAAGRALAKGAAYMRRNQIKRG